MTLESPPRASSDAVDSDLSPADAVRPRPPRRWFEGLDGVRFIAAFLIIVHHAGFSTGATFRWDLAGGMIGRMDIGVAIFFVLSGFLLFRPYVKAQFDGTDTPSAGEFFIRRIVRIYPAYWAALTIQLLLGTIVISGLSALVSSYLLTNVYDPDLIFVGMIHTWSLATELGFYLLLPFLALGARKLTQRLAPGRDVNRQALGLLVVCLVLALASLVFRAAMAVLAPRAEGGIGLISHLWTLSFLDVFAAGMALAVLSVWADHHRLIRSATERATRPVWIWWAAAAGVFWMVSTQLGLARGLEYSSIEREAVRQFLYTLVGVCVIAPVVFAVPRSTPGLRMLASRPMAYLGLVSYGIYLWHQAVITWCHDWFDWPLVSGNFAVCVAVTTVLSVAIAAVSYHLLEHPVSKLAATYLSGRRE